MEECENRKKKRIKEWKKDRNAKCEKRGKRNKWKTKLYKFCKLGRDIAKKHGSNQNRIFYMNEGHEAMSEC